MKLTEYAEKFIGRPYVWGGDGSGKFGGGFDCSGFVLECLWATGQYKGNDCTSKALCKALKKLGWTKVRSNNERAGDICFWGSTEDKITHVSIVFEKGSHIEAGGGGSSQTDFIEKRFVRDFASTLKDFCRLGRRQNYRD